MKAKAEIVLAPGPGKAPGKIIKLIKIVHLKKKKGFQTSVLKFSVSDYLKMRMKYWPTGTAVLILQRPSRRKDAFSQECFLTC